MLVDGALIVQNLRRPLERPLLDLAEGGRQMLCGHRSQQVGSVQVPNLCHGRLGYAFEAGSMIAALCACAAVRFYVVQKDHEIHRLKLDAPISLVALMFTAAAVIRIRPDPAMALVYGTTFGIMGAGILAIVKKNADRVLSALGLSSSTDSSGPS